MATNKKKSGGRTGRPPLPDRDKACVVSVHAKIRRKLKDDIESEAAYSQIAVSSYIRIAVLQRILYERKARSDKAAHKQGLPRRDNRRRRPLLRHE